MPFVSHAPKNNRGARRLREWRYEHKKTQTWLADEIGADQAAISRWELGREIPLWAAWRVQIVTSIRVDEWITPDELAERAA